MESIGNRNIDKLCKRFCGLRCAYAILCSVGFQYLLLGLFLQIVNFSIFHPIQWISNTIRINCSISTWLYLMPLLTVVIAYGIFLAYYQFGEQIHYRYRFVRILKTFPPKILFSFIHILIGLLTGWLYLRFVSSNYGAMTTLCDKGICINERCACIILAAAEAGMDYFVRKRLNISNRIQFSMIRQPIYSEIRSHFFHFVGMSFCECLKSTFVYIGVYSLFGYILSSKNYDLFKLYTEANFSVFDLQLFIYVLFITTQIWINMHLMDCLFTLFLSEYHEFPIEQPPPSGVASINAQHKELTLIEALKCTKVPIIQQLATLDLYTLATHADPARRSQLFTLSIPGGHPYNWKSIRDQCLNIIDTFRDEVEKMSGSMQIQNTSALMTNAAGGVQSLRPPATEYADNIRYRQYNERFGIRNMAVEEQQDQQQRQQQQQQQMANTNNFINDISTRWTAVSKRIQQIPGIYYWFGESAMVNVGFLLQKESSIRWTCEGLAALATHSIKEDRYGVVQGDLATIIMSLMNLKQTLDMVCTLNFTDRLDHANASVLRNSVRRSIYQICTAFADYIEDIIIEPNNLRLIQNFLLYKE